MKRAIVIAAAAALVLSAGCSENQLQVMNKSNVDVYLNFRADENYIPPYDGTSATVITINDIPNGTYGYGTVYSQESSGDPVTAGDGLSGDLTFERSETNILLTYGVSSESDTSSGTTYTLWAVHSSDQPAGAIVSP